MLWINMIYQTTFCLGLRSRLLKLFPNKRLAYKLVDSKPFYDQVQNRKSKIHRFYIACKHT